MQSNTPVVEHLTVVFPDDNHPRLIVEYQDNRNPPRIRRRKAAGRRNDRHYIRLHADREQEFLIFRTKAGGQPAGAVVGPNVENAVPRWRTSDNGLVCEIELPAGVSGPDQECWFGAWWKDPPDGKTNYGITSEDARKFFDDHHPLNAGADHHTVIIITDELAS